MTGVRDIRLRIKSIKDTRQITNAMRLISASKLRKARKQLENATPYYERVKNTMTDILADQPSVESPYFEDNGKDMDAKRGIVLITGDKGLAGGYNHNIIKLAEMLAENEPNHSLYIVGYMGREYLEKRHYNINKNFEFSMNNPTAYLARDITDIIIEDFLTKKIDEVYIVYTYMVSALIHEPKVLKLLPLEEMALRQGLGLDVKANESKEKRIFEYEPSAEEVFKMLVPKYVKGIMYGLLIEAFTCEQSARMSAMENATSNADKMLEELRMKYNRTRQALITSEINDITSGMNAI